MENKVKVLIVEDEIFTAKSLKIDLEQLSVDALDPVTKGEVAVKVALHEKPSLILMDIRLAGKMDGIEAAEEIINHLRIPIVFMTGFATDSIKERAMKLKPLAYIIKPIEMDRIRSIIDNLKSDG